MKDLVSPDPLNLHIPDAATLWSRAKTLPGIAPLDMADWLWVLDSYAGQMRLRETLIAEARDRVIAVRPEAAEALAELYALVLDHLAGQAGYVRAGEAMTCPDGRIVTLDPNDPLATLGRLVQEDLIVMQKPEGAEEHVMTAAVLCFPANWTLAEKIGRPMLRIHKPVDFVYVAEVAKRVQRLLDGVRPGRPLWRANFHAADVPRLHFPQREREKDKSQRGGDYYRSERQCLVRLPDTGAVVFSIHTILLAKAGMSPALQAAVPI